MHLPEIIAFCIVIMLTIGTVFWLWMIIDCATNRELNEGPKILWMFFIILTHWVGALIYFIIGRRSRFKSNQEFNQSDIQAQGYYQPYQQGYQSPKTSPPMHLESKKPNIQPKNEPYSSSQYEQPQELYPEQN